jgi:RHS repeat-associated protein
MQICDGCHNCLWITRPGLRIADSLALIAANPAIREPQYNQFAGLTDSFSTGVLWDAANRELSYAAGRWLSPDPAGAGWNQYAYATNPNSFVDPLGLYVDGPGQCSTGSGDPCYVGFGGGDIGNGRLDASCGANGVDPSVLCPICGPGGFGGLDPTPGLGGGGSSVSPLLGFVGTAIPMTGEDGLWWWFLMSHWEPFGGYFFGNNSPTGTIIGGLAANNGSGSWAWNFTKSFFTGFSLSTKSGTCLGVFADSVTAPMKQLRSAAQQYLPLVTSALQAGPSGAAMYMQQLNNMVASGAAEADPQVAAVVTTAGAAAATGAPYVSAAAPYVVPVGGDAILLNGVINEVQSGMSGQCTW